MSSEIRWYGAEVQAKVGRALAEMLTEAAFLIEGQAKINITQNGQVDTGFMRNSVYARAPEGESGPEAHAGLFYSPSEKRRVQRDMARPELPADKNEAVVGVAAEYAVYQEARQPFLYPAVVDVAGREGEIVAAGKKVVG